MGRVGGERESEQGVLPFSLVAFSPTRPLHSPLTLS